MHGDWRGTEQAELSMGGAFAVTEGFKYLVSEQRPDGGDHKSVPSGHTSVGFAAAATLGKRHRWRVGLPAHIVAALVGPTRLKAKKHFVGDVLVGAATGEASGWLLSSRHEAGVYWFS